MTMLDTDTVSPGDELPAGTTVWCCDTPMDATATTWTCVFCNTVIETRNGLVAAIHD